MRNFVYMPLMHAEDNSMQGKSLEMFQKLYEDAPEHLKERFDMIYAIRHADIIRRFGRYPHRNMVLGRISTPEEIAFLEHPNVGL